MMLVLIVSASAMVSSAALAHHTPGHDGGGGGGGNGGDGPTEFSVAVIADENILIHGSELYRPADLDPICLAAAVISNYNARFPRYDACAELATSPDGNQVTTKIVIRIDDDNSGFTNAYVVGTHDGFIHHSDDMLYIVEQ